MHVRVELPQHLRTLARVTGSNEITVELDADRNGGGGGVGAPTMSALFDAIEAQYPMLRGTIRDQRTRKRRDFVRFFACGEDISLEPPESRLPDAVVRGAEPFMIVGAIAGG